MTDTAVIFSILAKDKASGVMDKIGHAAGAMFSAFAVDKVFNIGKDAIESASNLAETQSKVNVLFGQGASAINAFAGNADKAFGQSKQQALDAAATFATFGKSAGLSGDQLVGFSTQMTGLASDMASFSNTSPQQAIDAIGAALRGEMEPIRQYGVLLDDASLRQQALAMGLTKTTTQVLTPQQKVLAAQALIMKQTGAAQGDFSRTSTGLANQQRIMAAEFENVKGKLGTGLLPIMLKFTTGLMAVIGFVQKNSSWLTPLAIGLGVVAAAIWVATTAQTAWNIAMTLNPIGLVVAAVIGLVAVFVYLWTHSAAFRNFFIGMWHDIWGFLKGVGAWFAGPFAGFFVDAWHVIAGAGLWLWHNVLDPIWQGISTGVAFVTNIVRSFANLFLWLGQEIADHVFKAVIQPTFKAFAVVATWLWQNVLAPVGAGIAVVFHGVADVATWLWQNAISPTFHGIADVATWLWHHALKPAFDLVMGGVHAVGNTFKSVFEAIGGFIASAFHNAIQIVKGSINAVIGLINSAIGFINGNVIDNANKVPGVSFPHIPTIPKLDAGGDVLRSGLAVIHRGERVVPAAQVRSLPANNGGGGQTTVTFRGSTDSAFATAFMNLVRAGLIQIEAS